MRSAIWRWRWPVDPQRTAGLLVPSSFARAEIGVLTVDVVPVTSGWSWVTISTVSV
jgi:hypothetical protein